MLLEEMGEVYGSDTAPIPTDEHLYHNNVARWVAIRYGKYKYIRTLVAGEMEEIYDLEADPEELTNLALRPEHQVRLNDLRARCVAELRRTGGRLSPTRCQRPGRWPSSVQEQSMIRRYSCAASRRAFLADLGMGFTGLALGAMLARDGVVRGAK